MSWHAYRHSGIAVVCGCTDEGHDSRHWLHSVEETADALNAQTRTHEQGAEGLAAATQEARNFLWRTHGLQGPREPMSPSKARELIARLEVALSAQPPAPSGVALREALELIDAMSPGLGYCLPVVQRAYREFIDKHAPVETQP